MTISKNHPWRRGACLGHAVEGLCLAFMAIYAAVQLITGRAQVARNEGLVLLALALASGALVLLARALGRGRRGALGVSLAWHAIFGLGIGGGAWQADQRLLGAGILVWCVVISWASVRAVSYDD